MNQHYYLLLNSEEKVNEIINQLTKINEVSNFEFFSLFVQVSLMIFAIYVAIEIPNKIAKNQNKIALYDKRESIYIEVLNLYQLSRLLLKDIDSKDTNDKLFEKFLAAFIVFSDIIKNDILSSKTANFRLEALIQMQEYLYSKTQLSTRSEFLFEEDITNSIKDLVSSQLELCTYVTMYFSGNVELNKSIDFRKILEELESNHKDFETTTINKIKKAIKIEE